MILDHHQDQQDFTPWPINDIHTIPMWSKASGVPTRQSSVAGREVFTQGDLKQHRKVTKEGASHALRNQIIYAFTWCLKHTQFFKKHMDLQWFFFFLRAATPETFP